jgi:hypothetical protein
VALAYRLVGRKEASVVLPAMQISRVTTTGNVASAGISPDGRYVAFVLGDPGAPLQAIDNRDGRLAGGLRPRRERHL